MDLGYKSQEVLKEFKKFQKMLEANGLKVVQITLDPIANTGKLILQDFREFKAANNIHTKHD
jgi:hypothetical protein